ncbi:hypothetical protein HFN01_08600 [Rhizobium leguminosarum]|uniref:hypothetical protein n=1 Tax=Rhizobium leguminosarum TaxID=384 RepID=UPI001C9392C3|nr:hypothetical protein [Rhizobium leguminosarum]MBY5394887.1 hypothetical protein [Rhizobium leguminosarum]
MSVQNVRAAIERFLSTNEPEVLCIRGEWGTGKTWTWDDVLKTQGQAGKIPLTRYAKVSLFGLNTLAEIKREIFQSTIDVAQIDKPFDVKNYKDLYAGVKSQSNLFLKAVDVIFDKSSDAIIEAIALTARNMIVCVDDLERKGEELRSVDVLGYISQLAIDRKCKVVLLLNDAQLEDKEEFEGYLEKVVDVHLRFQPSHEEIAEIAIPGDADNIGNLIKDFAIKLGISNVRVIRKVYALSKLVTPLFKEYSFKVTINAVRAITLFGWSYFQPESGPSLDYLRKVNTYASDNNNTDEDLRWRDILLRINFYSSNDFDELLLTGIQNGYFAEAEITQHARVLNEADIRGKADMEMRAAWDFYHNSFKRPADLALGHIFDTYKRLSAYMSLNDTVQLERLFRELGDPRALEFIDMYAAANADTPSAFDLDHLHRFGEELTPEVNDRLTAARTRQKPMMTADELFLALAERGFEEDVVVGTALLPVDDYVRVLKTHEDEALSNIIDGLRQYITVGNPNEQLVTILDNAGKALIRIAAESAINKRRAMRLGLIQRLEAKRAARAAQVAEIVALGKSHAETYNDADNGGQPDSTTTVPSSDQPDSPPQGKRSRSDRERQP